MSHFRAGKTHIGGDYAFYRGCDGVCVLGYVLGYVLGGVGVASPDTMSTFSVAIWEGGAFSVNGTNKFDHCAAFARYKNGTNMLFGVSRTLQWSMGFENPNWALQAEQSYPIAFTIDRDSPSLGTDLALNKTEVEARAGAPVPLTKHAMATVRWLRRRLGSSILLMGGSMRDGRKKCFETNTRSAWAWD